MIDLALNHQFSAASWSPRVSGAGTATVAGGVLTCNAGAGDSALMDYYVPVVPGQIVEVEVFGRLISGTAGVYLDFVNHNSSQWTTPEQVLLADLDWRRYRVSYRVPQKVNAGTLLRVTIGVPSAPAGNAQFLAPIIRTSGGYGVSPILACGLLRVENGVTSLHPNFPSFGVASVARTAIDTITVTLDHELPTAPANVRARVLVSGTPDSAQIPLAGNVVAGAAPTFFVRWTNGVAIQDISGAGFRYCMFEVKL